MKAGWEYKTLGEICKIYNGNSINADYKKKHFLGATGGLPFIATKDVSPLGTIDYNNGVRIPNYEEFKVAPANSVFICAEGGSAGKKFAYVEKEVCFGNKLFCITPKDKAIKGKFIYHFVQSDNFRGQFSSLLTGLIGGVSAKKFQTIEIPIPPLSEQQSIVDYLDSAFAKIDAMKANAEKALNEAKALFQASLKEMLEPKEGWEEKKLMDIGELKNGINFNKNESGYNVHILGVGDFGKLFLIDDTDCLQTISLNSNPSEEYILKNEDIVFVRSNGNKNLVGRCVLIHVGEEPCSFSGFCIRFRKSTNEVDACYLTHFLKTENARKKLVGNGANISNLNQKVLNEFVVSYPSISEQQYIVATLDSLKSKVDRLQENYDKISQECDALKQAMLRQVFE